jgi:hypothetical protein
VIEALAKKIGYSKVRAFTISGDAATLKDFIVKTGLTVHVYVSPEPFRNNNVSSVPVTFIETDDGRKLRFDGFTDSFLGQPATPNDLPASNGRPQAAAGAVAGKQCGSK